MAILNDTLTQQLRSIRVQKELSIESIAETLGLSPDSYAKIENGETPITLDRIESIAEALDVSAFELLNASSIIFSNNSITTEKGVTTVYHSNANSNDIYIGVSSEVLEKLLRRIDTLEAELEKTRKQS